MHEQGEQPRRSTTGIWPRVGILAIVILGSAGVGYLASRLWPLPRAYIQFGQVESLGQTGSRSAPRIEPARIVVPTANPLVIPPLAIPLPPELSAGAVAARGGADSTSMSFTVINPGYAQPPPTGGQSIETGSADAERENVNAGAVGPAPVEKGAKARGPRKGQTGAIASQSAPAPSGYKHDRAMREFMSTDLNSSR